MGDITGDCDLQSQTLEDLSDAVNYRRWLADLARPHLGTDPIEAGSGLGYYAGEWLDDVDNITVTEGEASRLAVLRDRMSGSPKVTTRALLLPTEERAQHSSFVAFNVLEHIEDDVAALRSAARLVAPGGTVVLVVPAFPFAMSRFDRSIGHFRRYTVASMREKLAAAGLVADEVRYVNPLGLVAWTVMIKWLRGQPSNGLMLRAYDRLVVPLLRRLDHRHVRGRGPRFGQSVLAVARTPC